ncbi:LysR family transcriptional regulator [Variovorax paradoxus]|nr:LysR family transcriptional regulator [Variovorax paradoxus]
MRFDLTDLRLFQNVVQAGTITGGAERTHMTLASASERVRGMEAELGVALLVRDPRGVAPTEAGRTLLHHARAVLLQMERMHGELGEYGAGLKGHVRLLCNTSALTEHLHEALSSFLALYPRISVDLEERASHDIVEALRGELGDIGIVSDAVDLAGLESFVFREDHLVLVVPRGDVLARRRRVALRELVAREFVGLTGSSPLQELVSHRAKRLGRRLAYRVRVRHLEAVCRMVEQGIGVGIVPQTVAARCARSMKIAHIALSDDWAVRNLMVCVRCREELPSNAQLMLQHLLLEAP